jgi:predicted ATPase
LAFELEKSSNLKIESQYFPVGHSPAGGGSVVEAVNAWLSYLGMTEQVSVRSVAGYEPRLEVGGKTFNQVGTGYSQIVPVIAQGLLGTHRPKENLLILVEQPELHLHPDLQAKLADFFLTVTSGSKGRVKFVVESHSEYLITRLRLLVARGDFGREDLSILFFEAGQGSDCMAVSQATVGDAGSLTYWPTGFSDAALLDKYELAAIQHNAKEPD